jgi:thioredoxin reductase
MSLHQALLLPEWGEVTLLTNGTFAPDAAQREQLASRNVSLEAARIARLEGHADARLADGRLLSFAGLFTVPRNAPATPVAERLGCALEETPFGVQIKTDGMKETTVPGAFACGDAACVPHSVSLAVGDGAWAGAQVHRSLVF